MLYPTTIQNGALQRGTVQCVMTTLPFLLHFHLLRLLISLSTPIKSSGKFLAKNARKILDDYPNTLHIIFISIRIDNPSNYLNRHNYIISSIIPITFTLPSYPILSFVILVVPSHFLPHIFFLATSCVLIVMRLFVSMIFTSSNSLSNSSSKHLILSDDITCIYQILSPRVYSRHTSFYEIHLIAYLIT